MTKSTICGTDAERTDRDHVARGERGKTEGGGRTGTEQRRKQVLHR
jgi:hypothetical protein